MRTLYVGGLSTDTDAEGLKTLFCRYGTIRDARVVLRSTTGECRGFGYVTFTNDGPALAAMEALDGRVVRGTRLRVDLAK